MFWDSVNEDRFSEMMARVGDQFSSLLRVHEDAQLLSRSGGSAIPFRVLSIVHVDENYQHGAIIVDSVGPWVGLVADHLAIFLTRWPTQAEIRTRESTEEEEEWTNKRLVTTGRVYLYARKLVLPASEVREIFAQRGFEVAIRDDQYWNRYWERMRPDAFISHDSRDKEDLARPLAHALQRRLVKVWFDETSLRPGDSLDQSIRAGLKSCRRAVLLITPNFLSNQRWARKELEIALEIEKNKNPPLIVPIWANVGVCDIQNSAPALLDKVAIRHEGNVEALADEIARDLKGSRPEMASRPRAAASGDDAAPAGDASES